MVLFVLFGFGFCKASPYGSLAGIGLTRCVAHAGWELGTFPQPLACWDDRYMPPHSALWRFGPLLSGLWPWLSKLYIKMCLFISKIVNKNGRFVKFYFVFFLVILCLKPWPDWSCYLLIIPLPDTEAHHLHSSLRIIWCPSLERKISKHPLFLESCLFGHIQGSLQPGLGETLKAIMAQCWTSHRQFSHQGPSLLDCMDFATASLQFTFSFCLALLPLSSFPRCWS